MKALVSGWGNVGKSSLCSRLTGGGKSSMLQGDMSIEMIIEKIKAFHPVRRFLARVGDILTIFLLFGAILGVISFSGRPMNDEVLGLVFLYAFPFLLVVVEAFCLSIFGTTLFKYLFGIYVLDKNGNILLLYKTLLRTFLIYLQVCGLYMLFIFLGDIIIDVLINEGNLRSTRLSIIWLYMFWLFIFLIAVIGLIVLLKKDWIAFWDKFIGSNVQVRQTGFFESSEVITENPQVHPVRRFLARAGGVLIINESLVVLTEVWSWFSFEDYGLLINRLILFSAVLFLLIPFEIFCLSVFGTTPFKYVFGIHVLDKNNKKLSFFKSLKRTLLVYTKGLGLLIIVFTVIFSIVSYRRLKEHGVTSWDESVGCNVQIRKGFSFRKFLVLAGLIFVFVVISGVYIALEGI